MQKLGSAEIVQLLLAITLMLGFGRAFGELFRKIKQPAVVGEILAGIFLGPTIFGTIFPEIQQFIFPSIGLVTISLDAIVNLSIILYPSHLRSTFNACPTGTILSIPFNLFELKIFKKSFFCKPK